MTHPVKPAWAVALGCLVIAEFQVGLALGAFWGEAAWGGAYVELSAGLRLASAFAAVVWVGAATLVIARDRGSGGVRTSSAVRVATWALAGRCSSGAP